MLTGAAGLNHPGAPVTVAATAGALGLQARVEGWQEEQALVLDAGGSAQAAGAPAAPGGWRLLAELDNVQGDLSVAYAIAIEVAPPAEVAP